MNEQLVKPLYCYDCGEGTEHILSKVNSHQEIYTCTWCTCKSVVNVINTAKAV